MNKKTLWISDLDGTLLNKDKHITEYTRNVLNNAIHEGLVFSIATARTPATVVDLLEGIELSIPVVVMNGAAIYNTKTFTYEHVTYLELEMVQVIRKTLEAYNQSAFTYCIDNNELVAYHETLTNEAQRKFYEERQNNPRKRFVVERAPEDARAVYFVVIGNKDTVQAIYETLKIYKKLSQVFYEDIYNKGVYYLEIYSHLVSKASAIKYLQEHYHYDKIICFGDNYNDVEMFELADEGYAVANAVEKIKQISIAVIGRHDEDGVAKFIEANWQK